MSWAADIKQETTLIRPFHERHRPLWQFLWLLEHCLTWEAGAPPCQVFLHLLHFRLGRHSCYNSTPLSPKLRAPLLLFLCMEFTSTLRRYCSIYL